MSNINNIELQKSMKKQSLQLTELQSMYDEIQRRLEITLDKYYAQRHLQSLGAELGAERICVAIWKLPFVVSVLSRNRWRSALPASMK